MPEPHPLDPTLPAARLEAVDACWFRIGIGGDRSCPELREHVHCSNCPVFGTAARGFFDRPAPPGYVDEWTAWLREGEEAEGVGEASVRRSDVGVLLFRLGVEWLAFRTQAVVEAALPRPVHRVPHRSNAVLRGLVNLRGQLQLCFSLYGLLGAPEPPPSSSSHAHARGDDGRAPSRERLIVLRDCERSEVWACAVDEVHGVEHFPRGSLQGVPSTLANPSVSFSQAVVPWRDRSVGLLDESRVFAALRSVGQ